MRNDYYSPVPDLEALPEGFWERRSALGGVDLDVAGALELVEGRLAPFVSELDVPLDAPSGPGGFFIHNETFESVDAELLYAMIRAHRPARVVELGSGYTSLLINMACARNAAEGHPPAHIAFDPHPRLEIFGDGGLAPPSRLEAVGAVDVPLGAFGSLVAGDILFVDTTHTVKLGGDVNFLVLDVLPRLAPGVIVHFHDVFLPYEYPRDWFEQMGYYWAEQYLLQAFLAFNGEFDVLIAAHALAREFPERLGRVVASFGPDVNPGSLWLRRREAAAK